MSELLDIQSHMNFVWGELSKNDFLAGGVIMAGVWGFWNYVQSIPNRIRHFIREYFTISLTIQSTDFSFKEIMFWINTLEWDKLKKKYYLLSTFEFERYQLYPAEGFFLFRHNGKFFWINSEKTTPTKDGSVTVNYETITISCFGRNKRTLENLLETAILSYKENNNESNLKVHISKTDWWDESGELPKKSGNNLILVEGLYERIHNSIKTFYQLEEHYLSLNIPYKKTFLLTGPPGTGKTSLIQTLASEFNKQIHYLSLNVDTKDSDLISLVAQVSKDSVLVIEDIDSYFEADRDMVETVKIKYNTFINILDGCLTKHGLLTLITTNKPEVLDPSFYRAGRVDEIIQLDLCTKEQAERIITKFEPDIDNIEKEQLLTTFMGSESNSPAKLQEIMLDRGNWMKHAKPKDSTSKNNPMASKESKLWDMLQESKKDNLHF